MNHRTSKLSDFRFVTMDDSTLNHQNGGQMGPQSGSAANNKQIEESNPKTQQYSIPGILHFIQHEWARFELERSQWEVDRAELQVCNIRYKRTGLRLNSCLSIVFFSSFSLTAFKSAASHSLIICLVSIQYGFKNTLL